jgi:hypothetical protein
MLLVRAIMLAIVLASSALPAAAESGAVTLSLDDGTQVTPRNVTVEAVRYGGSAALAIRQSGPYRGFDTDTLKRGPDAHGTVGLFVGIGTDGHFRNLSVRAR